MLVFVYGTLRRGEGNHRLLRSAQFVAHATTRERMTMLDLGPFPAVILQGGPSPIVGELFDVDCETFAALDRLEGYPHHYDRAEIDVETASGEIVRAWMYHQPPRGQRAVEVIQSGDWLDRTRVRSRWN